MMSALVSVLAPAVPLAVGLLGPGPAARTVYPMSFVLLGMAFSGYGACFGPAAALSLAGLALAGGLPEPRAGGVPVAGEEATPTTNG